MGLIGHCDDKKSKTQPKIQVNVHVYIQIGGISE